MGRRRYCAFILPLKNIKTITSPRIKYLFWNMKNVYTIAKYKHFQLLTSWSSRLTDGGTATSGSIILPTSSFSSSLSIFISTGTSVFCRNKRNEYP
jgi:hypothetical protein